MTHPDVEIGGERRVSRRATQFFIDWIDQRTAEIDRADAEQQREVIGSYEQARAFFKGLADFCWPFFCHAQRHAQNRNEQLWEKREVYLLLRCIL